MQRKNHLPSKKQIKKQRYMPLKHSLVNMHGKVRKNKFAKCTKFLKTRKSNRRSLKESAKVLNKNRKKGFLKRNLKRKNRKS